GHGAQQQAADQDPLPLHGRASSMSMPCARSTAGAAVSITTADRSPLKLNGKTRLGGTGAKRIRTESLTSSDSGFVPYKMLYLLAYPDLGGGRRIRRRGAVCGRRALPRAARP